MRRAFGALAFAPLFSFACSRTGLYLPDGGTGEPFDAGLPPECEVDEDCATDDLCLPAFCAPPGDASAVRRCETVPVGCDDGDACTTDRCEPSSGACSHERPSDKDHDGVVGEAPSGVPASCGGLDCDDEDPTVFPGRGEDCDGRDNDCDGGIDEGAVYYPLAEPVLLAPSMKRSDVSSIAFDGSEYGVVYTHLLPDFRTESYFERLNQHGVVTAGPALVSMINADTYSGVLAWSGTSFLTAWADARQAGNYEIYATRFDRDANKLDPDQRLTSADDFSLRPGLRHTGKDFILIWEDHRFEELGGVGAIFGRRLSEAGEPLGDEVRLTDVDEDAEFASFDVGEERLGLAYVVAGALLPDGTERSTSVRFRTYDLELGAGSAPVELGMDAQEPSVAYAAGRFISTWHTGSERRNWGGALVGALVDESGSFIVQRSITSGDTHAKHRSLVVLGDRVLMVWSATPSDVEPFELFYETLSPTTLDVQVSRQLLVKSPLGWDLTSPHAALGPDGDIGVVYDEIGTYQAYFLPLRCGFPLK